MNQFLGRLRPFLWVIFKPVHPKTCALWLSWVQDKSEMPKNPFSGRRGTRGPQELNPDDMAKAAANVKGSGSSGLMAPNGDAGISAAAIER